MEHAPAKTIMDRLNRVLPVGLEILDADGVIEGVKSPLSKLNASEYRITLCCPAALDAQTVRATLEDLFSASEVRLVRRRDETKEVDIRPYMLGVEVDECSAGKLVLTAQLQSGSSGGARPQDLAQALAGRIPGLDVSNIHRVRQFEIRTPKSEILNEEGR
jgi:hypothetical protein